MKLYMISDILDANQTIQTRTAVNLGKSPFNNTADVYIINDIRCYFSAPMFTVHWYVYMNIS